MKVKLKTNFLNILKKWQKNFYATVPVEGYTANSW